MQSSLDSEQLSDSGDAESVSSELERLEVDESKVEWQSQNESGETERAFARSKSQEEHILQIINKTASSDSTTIDLGKKGMLLIPEELLELKTLENLYLEGNYLSYLPEDFFEKLPNLKWLDLRSNYLSRIPSSHLGRHQHLKNLLLEGNSLKTLPLELGNIKTLHGLNICNNPLEFPPAEILEKGSHEILKFMQQITAAKSAKFSNGDSLKLSGDGSESSDDDDWDGSMGEYAEYMRRQRCLSHELSRNSSDNNNNLVGPVPSTAELHRPVSYTEMRQQHLDKLKRAKASGTMERKKSAASSVMSWKVNPYPEPPDPDYVDQHMAEERRLARTKEMKLKQEAILQKRRDESVLKEWRDETKRLKEKKLYESLKKGTKDFIDPVTKAPFGYSDDHLKMPTNEERIKEGIKSAHEKVRRPVSPATRRKMEMEKATRVRELEARIKTHTAQMVERRKRPRGNPQQEMEAAQKELAVLELVAYSLGIKLTFNFGKLGCKESKIMTSTSILVR
ncbi:leucine-rich repeat-containing protein 27-like isoform X2 [Gigantopelta aegis]|uniref:leucine-rich repeat-containing protein 27-like isoform X2 n=1 Tax=Gigantopelta aegis TaxID=1735272 RepID=UPI001B88BFEC|nr:leucine-rich repeat-containing protein 27-like isoform X2 [Gigantopelta aegis]